MAKPPKASSRKVTQAMIAREAGVSQTLVSLVLSSAASPERVAEETRRRIIEVAQRLGYATRSGGGRQKAFALILPVVSRAEQLGNSIYAAIDDFYARTQSYVAEAAYRKGYSLMVRFYEHPTELTHWLTEWDVDGVLWHASDEKLLEWIAERYPTAQLHLGPITAATDIVTASQEEIPLVALRYLYARGHRRICFVPGPGWGKVAKIRAEAFRDAANAKGLPLYELFLGEGMPSSSQEIVTHCLRLLELPKEERPTVFVLGDPFALVLAKEVQQRGLSIPGDVSIVGIDNLSAGALYNPAITSIDVCQREVSETAVAMLVERIANPDKRFQKIYISPNIIERNSVATLDSPAALPARR